MRNFRSTNIVVVDVDVDINQYYFTSFRKLNGHLDFYGTLQLGKSKLLKETKLHID